MYIHRYIHAYVYVFIVLRKSLVKQHMVTNPKLAEQLISHMQNTACTARARLLKCCAAPEAAEGCVGGHQRHH